MAPFSCSSCLSSFLSSCQSDRRWSFPVHTLSVSVAAILLFYVPANKGGNLALTVGDPEWWSFYSCQLVHTSADHLWYNLVLVLITGGLLEVMHGSVATLVSFWVAGVSGIYAEAVRLQDGTRLLGMSAAAYGTIGALAPHILLNWRETYTVFRIVWMISLVLVIVITVVEATSDERRNVAHTAHGIGFLQGILVGGVVLRNRRIERWECIVRVVSFAGAVGLLSSLLARHFS